MTTPLNHRHSSTLADAMHAAGATNPRPGIYVLDGNVHCDAEELIRQQGLEPTPERVEAVMQYIEAFAAERGAPFLGRAEW